MKVKELIEKLQALPEAQEAPVYVGYDGTYATLFQVDFQKAGVDGATKTALLIDCDGRFQ